VVCLLTIFLIKISSSEPSNNNLRKFDLSKTLLSFLIGFEYEVDGKHDKTIKIANNIDKRSDRFIVKT
jgi:hypothetical protein